MRALLLATLDTKAAEAVRLADALRAQGVETTPVDLSLDRRGGDKIAAMATAAASGVTAVKAALRDGPAVVIGFGGGTGSRIALDVMRELPYAVAKLLVTTLAADPRGDAAETGVVILPSGVDLAGDNAALRTLFARAAALAAALAAEPAALPEAMGKPAVAMTALGVTSLGAERAASRLAERGAAVTTFHAAGFGGATLARQIAEGAFAGLLDWTVHEATRLLFGGPHGLSRRRFTIAGSRGLPQLVLPGRPQFPDGGDRRSGAPRRLSRAQAIPAQRRLHSCGP